MSLNFVLIISDDPARAERILKEILAAAANQQQQQIEAIAAGIVEIRTGLHSTSAELKQSVDANK